MTYSKVGLLSSSSIETTKQTMQRTIYSVEDSNWVPICITAEVSLWQCNHLLVDSKGF
jgi:hypothetical protein